MVTLVFAARDAGAKAVIAYHEASGRWQPLAGSLAGAPASYAIPSEEAVDIRERLTTGPVELSWTMNATSPFVYNLGFTQDTPFTDAREFVVHDKKLGRTEATYQAMGVATDYIDLLAALDASGNGVSVGSFESVHAPSRRTELYTAGDIHWQAAILGSFPFGEVMVDQARAYKPGSVRSDAWYDGVVAPPREPQRGGGGGPPPAARRPTPPRMCSRAPPER